MPGKFSLPKPAMLVYYFVKLVGLGPFTVENNRLHSPRPIYVLYLIGIAAAYLILAIVAFDFRLVKFNTDDYFSISNLLIIAQHFGNSPGVFFSLGIFLLMCNRVVRIVNKLCDLSDDIQILGVREDHEDNFRKTLAVVATANVVLIATCVVLCVIEPHWSICISIKYCIECWFVLNVALGFAQILLHIKRRFILINEKLSEPFVRPIYHAGSLDDLRGLRTVAMSSRKPRGENLDDLKRVRSIEAVHLELDDLVDQTTDLFTAPIIFISMHALALLIISFYWIYSRSRNSSESPIGYVVCPLIRTVILVVQLSTMVYASTTTCYEGNATKAVLSRMWDASTPQNVKNELLIFSLQLLHKPVAVSVLDYFILDYSYLYKIFCAVVTYLIVVVQFVKVEISPF